MIKTREIITVQDKLKYNKETRIKRRVSRTRHERKGVVDMSSRVTPTRKVEIIFKDDIKRKPSIIVDQKLGCRVISRVNGVQTLKEMAEEI